ncbi:hypothetical protein BQ1740_3174 [Bacillus subtilis]|nr:hypothetical protein BQ1740_3174 [Bacillus subtilis]
MIGYMFLEVNIVYAEYYQTVSNIRISSAITLNRGQILLIPFLLILPIFLGSMSIWHAFQLA